MTEWRKIEELKPAPIRHPELPPALVTRIDSLRSTLDEVYPQSRAEWLEGFQRDANPDQEILWWERLARCYVEYSGKRALNVEQRQTAFNVMFKLLLGSRVEDIRWTCPHFWHKKLRLEIHRMENLSHGAIAPEVHERVQDCRAAAVECGCFDRSGGAVV